jgi:hypothetical protein
MAITGATQTSSVTELIATEYINDFIGDYLGNYKNPTQFFLPISITNGASTVSQTRWDSPVGTVPDHSAGVDTEFNATEATDLTAVELTTSDATFSVVEYGLLREPSDTALEDATLLTVQDIVAQAVGIIADAMNSDACALFASLSNGSGSTGANLSIATVDAALYALAGRGAMGELVGILDNVAANDFQDALQAASTNLAIYAGAADRMMNVSVDSMQGRNVQGYVLSYKGVPFHRTGLCATANTAADTISAIFVRGDLPAQRGMATYGQAERRPFRVATQRDESARCTELVFSARWGCGEIFDGTGQKLTVGIS